MPINADFVFRVINQYENEDFIVIVGENELYMKSADIDRSNEKKSGYQTGAKSTVSSNASCSAPAGPAKISVDNKPETNVNFAYHSNSSNSNSQQVHLEANYIPGQGLILLKRKTFFSFAFQRPSLLVNCNRVKNNPR